MVSKFIRLSALLVGLAVLGAMNPASATAGVIYGFTHISDNSGQAAALASQLSVEVSDIGGGQVEFAFTNAVGIASNVTEIYFDDGALLGIASVANSTTGATTPTFFETSTPNPTELPGGGTLDPAFETTAGFSADTDSGPNNGINEAVDLVLIVFDLAVGSVFQDVLNALDAGLALTPGTDADLQGSNLRIGLHVRSIGTSANSDAFINGPPDNNPPEEVIPEPTSLAIWATWALFGCGYQGYRRTRTRNRKSPS